MAIATVGLDIAKRVFQAHGVDVSGRMALRRKLQQAGVLGFFQGLAPCLVSIEACGSAHHWAREVKALGHEVRLMPASCVKRGKADAADVETLCEAVTRPASAWCRSSRPSSRRRPCCTARASCWCGSGPCWSTRCAGIWPSLASLRPRASRAWRTC